MTASNKYNAEFFERYLNDEVTLQERNDFDEQLVNDSDLLEYFTLFMDIDEAIDQPDVINLRQDLQNIYDTTSHEWLEETPMIVEDTHDEEIEAAISEVDVMDLRASLNDLHDLHFDELNTNEQRPVQVPVPTEELISAELMEEIENQVVDHLGAEIDKAIMEDDIMDLRNQLQEIGKEVNPVTKTRTLRHNFSRIASIAAVALLMLMGGTFGFMNFQPISSDRALEIFLNPYEGIAHTRGGSIFEAQDADPQVVIDKFVRSGHDRYIKNDFAGAVVFYEAAEAKGSEEGITMGMDVVAYSGIALLIENRTEEALEKFKTVIDNNDNAYIDQAEWYTALAHLRNDDVDEAVALLRELTKVTNHERKDEIRRLLKKLE